MKSKYLLAAVLILGSFLHAQNGQDLLSLNTDSEFLDSLKEQGLYGIILELQGRNNEALQYYRSIEGDPVLSRRQSVLEWYMGLRDAPEQLHLVAHLVYRYYLTGNSAYLEELYQDYPQSFEVYSQRTGRFFVLPFLFDSMPADTAAEQKVKDTGTDPASRFSEAEPSGSVSLPDIDDADEILLQLGSFHSEQNAIAHLQHLKSLGVEAFAGIKVRPEGTYFVTVTRPGNDLSRSMLELKERGVEGFPLYP